MTNLSFSMGMKETSTMTAWTIPLPNLKAIFVKPISILLLKRQELSEKFRFRTQIIHKARGGPCTSASGKKIGEACSKVQVELALRPDFLKYAFRNCSLEVFLALLLDVLQNIDELVHQVVVAELVGQNERWYERW
jgi:hypothetical protein